MKFARLALINMFLIGAVAPAHANEENTPKEDNLEEQCTTSFLASTRYDPHLEALKVIAEGMTEGSFSIIGLARAKNSDKADLKFSLETSASAFSLTTGATKLFMGGFAMAQAINGNSEGSLRTSSGTKEAIKSVDRFLSAEGPLAIWLPYKTGKTQQEVNKELDTFSTYRGLFKGQAERGAILTSQTMGSGEKIARLMNLEVKLEQDLTTILTPKDNTVDKIKALDEFMQSTPILVEHESIALFDPELLPDGTMRQFSIVRHNDGTASWEEGERITVFEDRSDDIITGFFPEIDKVMPEGVIPPNIDNIADDKKDDTTVSADEKSRTNNANDPSGTTPGNSPFGSDEGNGVSQEDSRKIRENNETARDMGRESNDNFSNDGNDSQGTEPSSTGSDDKASDSNTNSDAAATKPASSEPKSEDVTTDTKAKEKIPKYFYLIPSGEISPDGYGHESYVENEEDWDTPNKDPNRNPSPSVLGYGVDHLDSPNMAPNLEIYKIPVYLTFKFNSPNVDPNWVELPMIQNPAKPFWMYADSPCIK